MQRIYQSFDVGFFDLIIADESHRSIYNVYGDLFEHFDCLQVGLTATPADYITRNTYRMFNCEPGVPTAYYGLEQAVDDKFLTPFEVFEHTTQFLREGIQEENLTQAQIQELEEQGEDPADYDFAPEVVDKLIFNRDTNRILIRNLMENGLRDAANQTLGKSIIFARNHRHAVLLRELFDEMYPQYGGRFCQVIDNYDPRAEQLIDDFKGQGRNDELTIAISVDMLDTGIDVPEIVNLDFAKPIRSPIKFWQMIGRGTRLCKNLFGPGKDKSIFRIFDHWGNFERFGMDDFRPAEPSRQPSLMEEVFHARLNLAETARRKGNDFGLNLAINLIHSDINSLPTKSIQIKDQWRVIQSVSDIETLKDFAPNTLITLQQEIGPLMQWRDIRGAHDAYQLDRLIARLQNAVLNESNEVEDLKIILLDWIAVYQCTSIQCVKKRPLSHK